jgi:serine/threonine protein kinase
LELRPFLNIVLQIVDCLTIVHRKHIIHEAICTSNILWSATQQQIKIIGFDMSSELSKEYSDYTLESDNADSHRLLPFMSPEQVLR